MSLRLLHIVTSGDRRGGDVFASDLAAALIDLGIEQRVAALRPPSADPVPYAAPVEILSSPRINLAGIKLHAATIRALRTLTDAWRPDVVQAHGGEPYKYALAANPRRRPPIVYRRIGGAPDWITRGPRRIVHSQLMRRATRIVAVADFVRLETMRLFGVDASKILTIPNGVDTKRPEPRMGRAETRRSLGIPEGAVVMLSLGALSWEKDPLTQLEIADRVLRRRPEAMHLFVGEGPMRAEIDDAIERRGLWGRCCVLGPRSDVGDILSASDILLFTSQRGGMEGMPATIIEAGIARVPVAGYSVAGVPEIVQHGVTGLLASGGDVDSVVSHVLDLVTNADSRHAMGEAARENYLRSFDIRSVAPRYITVYERLAGQR